jgi:hypothetical protein
MTDVLEFGTGAIASPTDPRDFALSIPPAPAALPYHYAAVEMPPVLNQHATPTCVGHSSVTVKAWEERQDPSWARFLALDPLWLYWRCKATDGAPHVEGTYPRAALAVLAKEGALIKGASAPNPRLRIAAYYRVPVDVATMKRAILALGPLLVATRWYASWFYPTAGRLPDRTADAGGHAFVVHGWNDKIAGGSWICRNSWGLAWGDRGDFYMPYAMWSVALPEAWKALDIIGDR